MTVRFKEGDRVLIGRRKATVICEVPIGYVAIHFDSAHGKWSTVEKLERVRHLDRDGPSVGLAGRNKLEIE